MMRQADHVVAGHLPVGGAATGRSGGRGHATDRRAAYGAALGAAGAQAPRRQCQCLPRVLQKCPLVSGVGLPKWHDNSCQRRKYESHPLESSDLYSGRCVAGCADSYLSGRVVCTESYLIPRRGVSPPLAGRLARRGGKQHFLLDGRGAHVAGRHGGRIWPCRPMLSRFTSAHSPPVRRCGPARWRCG